MKFPAFASLIPVVQNAVTNLLMDLHLVWLYEFDAIINEKGKTTHITKIKEYQQISQRSRLLNTKERWKILSKLDLVDEIDDEEGRPVFIIKEHLVDVANDAADAKGCHRYGLTPIGVLEVLEQPRR